MFHLRSLTPYDILLGSRVIIKSGIRSDCVAKSTGISGKAFLASVAKFSVSSWANLVFGILSVMITTRIFSPEICGMLNLFNSATGFIIAFCTLGMDGAFPRFFHEPPPGWNVKTLFTRCVSIAVACWFILSLISVILYKPISSLLFHQESLLFMVLLSLKVLAGMLLTYFLLQFYRFANDPYHYNIQQILTSFFDRLFVIAAAFVSATVNVVLSFATFGSFGLALIYLFIQRKQVFSWKGGWHHPEMHEVYRFALFSWPSGIMFAVSGFIMPYLISSFLDVASLGIFASAGFFVAAFSVLQNGFRTYWGAFMYAHYQDENSKIKKTHSYIGISIILILALFILFQHLLYLFIGSAFQGSRVFFALLLLAPLLDLWQQTTCYGMALAKKNEESLVINVSMIVLTIPAAILFMQAYGLIGAAYATAIIAVLRFLFATWRGQCYYRSIRSKRETLGGLCILVLMGISNTVFNDSLLMESGAIIGLIIVMGIVYREAFAELYHVLRSMRKA